MILEKNKKESSYTSSAC